MSTSKGLSRLALQHLGVFLAASVWLASACASMSVAQEVGPLPPEARKPAASKQQMSKAITKLFKKGDDEDEALQVESPQGNGAPTNPMSASPQSGAPISPTEMRHPPMLTQPPLTNAKIEDPQIDSANPPILDHPRLDDPTNPLGFTDAEIKLKKCLTLIEANRYAEARPILQQVRQKLVDLTEAHIGLYKTLNQVSSARGQAELEKELALQFAQLRDRTMFEMAKVYIADKDYIHAIKELTDVVKSQPRSKMGLRSYELLQEIGFTEKLRLTQ